MDFRINKTAVKAYKLGEEPSDKEYWLTRTPEERIAAVEFLRTQYYGEAAMKAGLQRVFRIRKLKRKII
ncbi:MAG: hypothetical protein M0D57_07510 [Sphingobacteriales bacterium JAD_PAG50586_3]|nr:MAG: hypothetical protein M0D57_07510 [Sphingobacteriales bacterium JAD_PAG50586_3]